MAENSLIAWCHNTFNPYIGCVKVSDGCKNCYAETLVKGRMGRPNLWGPEKTASRSRTSPANWQRVRRWNKAAQAKGIATRLFSASLADVFEDHKDANAARPDLWQLVRETPFLHWQMLTKRPENIRDMLPPDWSDRGYPNVWLGTSIENMKVAARADELRTIPAVVRFISYEPALGPLDDLNLYGIDWILYGGESGPGYRQHDLAWPRAMRTRCDETELIAQHSEEAHADGWLGTTFFYKQSAAPRTEMGIELDGEIVRFYPRPRSLDWDDLPRALRLAYHHRYAKDIVGKTDAFGEGAIDERATVRAGLPIFDEV